MNAKVRTRVGKVRALVDWNPKTHDLRASGPMAEWLRRGLQILARRFDSGSGLHLSGKGFDPARGVAKVARARPNLS